MSNQNHRIRDALRSTAHEGRNNETKSAYFTQHGAEEESARSGEIITEGAREDISIAILSELRTFRKENNEKLNKVTDAVAAVEQAVSGLNERMTEVETRVSMAEDATGLPAAARQNAGGKMRGIGKLHEKE